MSEAIVIKEPPARYYTTDGRSGDRHDAPSLIDDPRILFTLPYAKLIDALSNTLFPSNTVETSGGRVIEIQASDARIDRFVFFRAVWDTNFGAQFLKALQGFANLVVAKHSTHFLHLKQEERVEFLKLLEKGRLTDLHQYPAAYQKRIFRELHSAIAEGLFSEPGYGGNANGIGWYYSNFMTLEDS